jgi:two-component system, chemotaxis family, CheB/CheR fusion protein
MPNDPDLSDRNPPTRSADEGRNGDAVRSRSSVEPERDHERRDQNSEHGGEHGDDRAKAGGTKPETATTPIIAGIGASAGGVQALQGLLDALPDDLGIAYVVVVHLSPEHRSELPSVLAGHTAMPVEQVTESVTLEPDHVYVIPPDRRLEIADNEIGVFPFDEPRGRRSPIDIFFRSLAEQHGDGFAIVLSGGGSDGAVGARAVKEAGGVVLVQEPTEAAHDSMPRSAIATGAADFVLPLRELAGRIAELAHTKRRIRERLGVAETVGLPDDDANAFGRILAHLHARTGHDFTKYKRGTVLRRLGRRMQVTRKETLAEYLSYLRQNVEEVQALFDDMLIAVTSFFRDPEAWEKLAERVIPALFDEVGPRDRIRVWVPGCATGEEAYSVVILLLEEARRRDVWPEVQVFATDLDEKSLAIARSARYSSAITADVSDERLKRFFRQEGDHYVVTKEVRDCVLFATHSLLRDPPFSRMDLISCRNLLIYLDKELQEQVFGILRYALRPRGYLFLGASEAADLGNFRVLDKKYRIYQAREIRGARPPHLPDLLLKAPRVQAPERPRERQAPESGEEFHRHLLEEVGPPSLIVDEDRKVEHLSETVGRYLQPQGGVLSRDVVRLVRPELQTELREALHHAFETGQGFLSALVPIRLDGVPRTVAMLVRPTRTKENERVALVSFVEGGPDTRVAAGLAGKAPREGDGAAAATRDESIQRLEQELRQTQDRLRTSHEESSAATEELRAANEELQSINEEYRSTAEELETSKEELQSINEELETVNHELQTKFNEVSRAHSDLENLMAATEIGTLFLDRDLRIGRFTPPLTEIFNIAATDRGRPITNFTHRLEYDDLERDVRQVLDQLTPVEHEVRSVNGRWFLMRLRPYRTAEHRIDGVVLTFVDITRRKEAEEELRRSEERYRILVDGVEEYAIYMLDADGNVTTWNRGAERIFGLPESAILGRSIRLVYTEEDRAANVPEREMEAAALHGKAADERWRRRADGTRFWGAEVITALRFANNDLRGYAVALRDQTERKAAEAARVHFQSLFESAPGLYLVIAPDNYQIVASSDAYLSAMNMKREDIIGHGMFDVIGKDSSQATREAMESLRASFERVKSQGRADAMAVQRLPIRRPEAEGGGFEERWWSPVNSPVFGPSGEIAYIIHRVEDVTPFIRQMREEGREAEGHRLLESRAQHMEAEILLRGQDLQRANEQLSALNDMLEERIRERNRLLSAAEAARADAEIANQAKSGLMMTLSHELRTPLNAILGYADLLDAGAPEPIAPEARAQVGRIRHSARHLSHLIEDMLTFSRMEAGRETLAFERVPLRPLMDEVAAIIEPLAAQRGLAFDATLETSAPAEIETDPHKVRQVLLNLVGNAVKFTPQGKISLTVRGSDGAVEFEVRDTGIGISSDHLKRLFEPFWQADSSLTRIAEGSGLGLAIAKRHVQMLGGEINVESKVGSGSVFTVRLPVRTRRPDGE